MLSSIPPAALALAAALLISAWALLSRRILKGKTDYLASGTLIEIVSTAFLAMTLLLLIPDFGSELHSLAAAPPQAWLILLLSTANYTALIFLFYKANQTAEATERSVVNQLQIPWSLLLAFIIFSEPFTFQKIAGALLIMAGAFACTWRKGSLRWHVEGVRLAAAAAILAGFGYMLDKLAIGYFNPLVYSLPLYLVPALLGILLLGKSAARRLSASANSFGKFVVAAGLVSVASYLAYIYSLYSLPVSQAVLIFSTNVVLTAFASMVFLSETEGWQQKIAGALLAFAGLALVVL